MLFLVCERKPRLVELCEAAGGLLFEISNTPRPEELQQVAASLSASVMASVSAGGTVPMAARP